MKKWTAILIIICAATVTVASLLGAHLYAWELIVWAWIAAWYATQAWRAKS